MHALLHQEARPGAAHVALVEEDTVHDSVDGLIDRRVVEDDVGGLATELERELVARTGQRPLDPLAHLGRAGERHLLDARMFDQERPRLAGAGDDVQDARWQVDLLADGGERQRGERRGFGRLQHHGVAACQRGRDLPRQHQQREIPRDDLPADADRLGIGPIAGVGQLVGPAGVVEEVRRHERQVDVAGFLDGLAVVDRLEDGQFAGSLLDRAGDAVQVLGPLGPRQPGPRSLGSTRRDDRGVDVQGPGADHFGQHFLGGGVHRLERGAVARLDEAAADEEAVRRFDGDDVTRLGRGGVLPRRSDEVGDGAHQSSVT